MDGPAGCPSLPSIQQKTSRGISRTSNTLYATVLVDVVTPEADVPDRPDQAILGCPLPFRHGRPRSAPRKTSAPVPHRRTDNGVSVQPRSVPSDTGRSACPAQCIRCAEITERSGTLPLREGPTGSNDGAPAGYPPQISLLSTSVLVSGHHSQRVRGRPAAPCAACTWYK